MVSRDCCVALPWGASGLSAVCDCGISWSYYFINANEIKHCLPVVFDCLIYEVDFLDSLRLLIEIACPSFSLKHSEFFTILCFRSRCKVHSGGDRCAALHGADLGDAGTLFRLFLPVHLVQMAVSHVAGDVCFVLSTKRTLISLLFLKNERKLTSLSLPVK